MLAIKSDPFISVFKLKNIILTTLKIRVSNKLIRVAIKKSGLTKKKARFFGNPKGLDVKIQDFVKIRDQYIAQGRLLVSLDETSFGRHGRIVHGYSPKGQQLRIQKLQPRMTTTTSIAVVSSLALIKRHEVHGSYNTVLFCEFIRSLDLSSGTVNVRFHHSKLAKEVAESKGFTFLFIPPYSPRFAAIEGVFSIVKRHFYKDNTIQESYDAVTTNHCKAFFEKALSETI